MKKFLLLIVLLFTAVAQAIDQYTNQTFLYPKEIFGSYGMEQASWHNIVYNKKSRGVALQAYVYAQTTIPDPTSSQYFLFDYLNQLTVQSGTSSNYNVETFSRNILGAWLGIESEADFTGAFSLTPKQSQYGVTLAFSQDLSKYVEVAYLRNSSFTVSLPIVHIKNQLVFQGSPVILNALQGGNAISMGLSEVWQYLVLDDQVQQATQLSDLKFQFASKYESDDDVQVATTTFLILPLGSSVSNRVLFQPAFNYNGHIVWGAGITFQFPLLRSEDRLTRICFYTGLENKFLIGNNQERTLELYNNPYSRYMPLYDRYTNTMVPGVNAFTRDCYVEPFNLVNFIAGLRYKHLDSIGEIGYELWGHDTEKITVNNNNLWVDNRYGIANINQDGVLDPTVQTASQSTINYVVPDTTTTGNIYISKKDLTTLTAAARATLVHRLYMSLSYGKKKAETVDYFLNFGLFMEVVQNNAAFSNWGGWLKGGVTF
ncbi:MAG: hypothetical protein JO129_01195 [Candidatus Dependentiae bacterium]|nr:hypothetical protein [Candidatus Dependentiae bacterium]